MAYIFVVGNPRTGTSLLQSVLCQAQNVIPQIKGAHFLPALVNTYRKGKESFDARELQCYFSDQDEVRNLCRRYVLEFLEHVRSRYGSAEHVVIKSVWMTPLLPDLYELVPEARFVISMRDPRDTIASMIEVGEKTEQNTSNNPFPRDIARLARRFMSAYGPAMNRAKEDANFKARIGIIKYEDLITQPEREIERLAHMTTLTFSEFDPSNFWGQVGRDYDADRRNNHPWVTALHGKGFSNSHIGRYHEDLTEEEVAVIEIVCADAFNLFGYPTTSSKEMSA